MRSMPPKRRPLAPDMSVRECPLRLEGTFSPMGLSRAHWMGVSSMRPGEQRQGRQRRWVGWLARLLGGQALARVPQVKRVHAHSLHTRNC